MSYFRRFFKFKVRLIVRYVLDTEHFTKTWCYPLIFDTFTPFENTHQAS